MPEASEACPIFKVDPLGVASSLTLPRWEGSQYPEQGGPMQDSTPADDARPRYLQLEINGMHCANCVVAIERSLKDAPGVQSVRASYPPGRAVIGYRDEIDLRGVHTALEEQGYSVKAVNEVDGPTPSKGDHNYLEIAA